MPVPAPTGTGFAFLSTCSSSSCACAKVSVAHARSALWSGGERRHSRSAHAQDYEDEYEHVDDELT